MAAVTSESLMKTTRADLLSEVLLYDSRKWSQAASLRGDHDGITMLVMQGQNWLIVYANLAFEKSSGLQPVDLCGRSFWEAFELVEPTKTDVFANVRHGETFEVSLTCNQSGCFLRLCLMPSENTLRVNELGLGLNERDVIDTADPDLDRVPHSSCYWLAMLCESVDTTGESPEVTRTCLHDSGPYVTDRRNELLISPCGNADIQYSPPANLGQLDFGPLLCIGSFGKVYGGVLNGHLAVSIKVLDCHGQGTSATSRQLAEVQVASMLDHPLVVKMLAHGTSIELVDCRPIKVAWIVQEGCDLGTLTSAADRGWLRVKRAVAAPPCVPTVLATLHDIAEAMAYVHSKSIIHADLTGRSIMLDSDSNARGFVAKVSDFGISRLAADCEATTTETLGTITHMSPELMERQLLLPAADVWAFGVLAWEAYHGKRAYAGRSSSQIVLDVVMGRSLSWPENTPKGFLALTQRCLSAGYEKRPEFPSIVNELDALG